MSDFALILVAKGTTARRTEAKKKRICTGSIAEPELSTLGTLTASRYSLAFNQVVTAGLTQERGTLPRQQGNDASR